MENIKNAYKISIVLPAYNEEKNIPVLYKLLKNSMEEISRSYEIIFIDDGSTDDTANILKELSKIDGRVSFFRMNKRSGQTKALAKGFDLAKNELIMTLDADMEHSPCYIKKFLEKIDEGYDAILGWRSEREGGQFYRKMCTYLGNRIINYLSQTRFKDATSSFRIFKKNLIEQKKLYSGYHRFLPIIFKKDAKIYEFPIRLKKRKFGRSRYNLLKMYDFIISVVRLLFFDKEYKNISVVERRKSSILH